MKTMKISDKDFIRLSLEEDNFEITIRYNKRSTLKKRFELIDKFKKLMHGFEIEDEHGKQ